MVNKSNTGYGETLETGKAGRKKMTDAEKETRKEFLKNESKNDKFVRLAKGRMPSILKNIKNLENLTAYQPTEAQKEKIVQDLKNVVNFVETSFSIVKTEKEPKKEYEI